MKKKTKENIRTATDIVWDDGPNKDIAYNNITVEFKDFSEVQAASAHISKANPKILNIKMGNPKDDFSCVHNLPKATLKKLKLIEESMAESWQKRVDKELQWKLDHWPTVVDMSWNKKMTKFTFYLNNGKEVKIVNSPGFGDTRIGTGLLSVSKPYEKAPTLLHINDQPYWDGIKKSRWEFFNRRNVSLAAKLYRERTMNEARLKALIEPKQEKIEPKNKPPAKEIFGQKISYVLRSLGRNGCTYNQAKRIMKHYNAIVTDKTIRGQLWCGQAKKKVNGKKKWTYPIAPLSEYQLDDLFAIAGED